MKQITTPGGVGEMYEGPEIVPEVVNVGYWQGSDGRIRGAQVIGEDVAAMMISIYGNVHEAEEDDGE